MFNDYFNLSFGELRNEFPTNIQDDFYAVPATTLFDDFNDITLHFSLKWTRVLVQGRHALQSLRALNLSTITALQQPAVPALDEFQQIRRLIRACWWNRVDGIQNSSYDSYINSNQQCRYLFPRMLEIIHLFLNSAALEDFINYEPEILPLVPFPDSNTDIQETYRFVASQSPIDYFNSRNWKRLERYMRDLDDFLIFLSVFSGIDLVDYTQEALNELEAPVESPFFQSVYGKIFDILELRRH